MTQMRFNTGSGNGFHLSDGTKPLPKLMLTFFNEVKGITNGCPCIVEIRGTQGCALVGDPARSRRRVQGRSQGTTLSASDLHNARATILNPFYNMECKIIKKIRRESKRTF